LEVIALGRFSRPLVLLVDELDLLRSLPFSPDELLTAIHCASARHQCDGSEAKSLVFCVFATVRPGLLWREAKDTDPGLGSIIVLQDFERDELFQVIDGLARCLLEKNNLMEPACLAQTKFLLSETLDRVFYWTHGHPYLTQKLGCVATHCLSAQLGGIAAITPEQCHRLVDSLAERTFTGRIAREQDCHVLWVRRKLLSSALDRSRIVQLLHLVKRGLRVDSIAQDETEALVDSGFVRIRNGCLEMRNRVYERLLDPEWLSIQSRRLGHSPSAPVGAVSSSLTWPSRLWPLPAINEIA
jgi:hypothetical protein